MTGASVLARYQEQMAKAVTETSMPRDVGRPEHGESGTNDVMAAAVAWHAMVFGWLLRRYDETERDVKNALATAFVFSVVFGVCVSAVLRNTVIGELSDLSGLDPFEVAAAAAVATWWMLRRSSK